MGARALPILGETRAVLAQSPTVTAEPIASSPVKLSEPDAEVKGDGIAAAIAPCGSTDASCVPA